MTPVNKDASVSTVYY